MDTSIFSSFLPLNVKTFFKIIGNVARPVRRSIRLTEVYRLTFLGKLVNNPLSLKPFKTEVLEESCGELKAL